jgi:hypothetical protein
MIREWKEKIVRSKKMIKKQESRKEEAWKSQVLIVGFGSGRESGEWLD